MMMRSLQRPHVNGEARGLDHNRPLHLFDGHFNCKEDSSAVLSARPIAIYFDHSINSLARAFHNIALSGVRQYEALVRSG
ncbi:hypothetical protein G7K_2864-t1 [Saitoella complicata NRRL Y-17804]|uniref:Uncharacterized protein n=1 Tax=Saitoella complicata (strain BCRC 22490 / CBS 7301 / JCM 7358 / NBRC 10748 / NRRL Y-17804) TaxID=698492 RepID=A0A0E9NFT0_SAICN|nr:hypothetical protein G7K_2864-t1 [Saitoella complicata NRRL Y-17804]